MASSATRIAEAVRLEMLSAGCLGVALRSPDWDVDRWRAGGSGSTNLTCCRARPCDCAGELRDADLDRERCRSSMPGVRRRE
jgi:hypothetical protein